MFFGFFYVFKFHVGEMLFPARLKACFEPLLKAELCGLCLFSDFVFLTQSGRSHSLSSQAKFLPNAMEQMAKQVRFTQAGFLISVSF